METHKTNRKSRPLQTPNQNRQSDDSGLGKRRLPSRNGTEHLPASGFVFSKEGYAVIFERSKTGYSAYSPDVPGCIAAARTLSATRKLFQSALRMHLDAMLEDGDPIPQALTKVGYAVA